MGLNRKCKRCTCPFKIWICHPGITHFLFDVVKTIGSCRIIIFEFHFPIFSAQYAGSHPLAPIARRGAPSTPNTKAGEHHKKESEANIQKRNWWIFQEILGAAALTMADRVLLCPDRGRDQYIVSNINPGALPSSPPPTHCTYNLPLQTRCKTSSVPLLVSQPCPAAITFTR